MATNENKVQFNIKNVHYAVMTADGETPTWENPVPVPGAVNLSLEASGEITPFYADGVVYYKSSSNSKPTQVDEERILRPTGEGLLRNSAQIRAIVNRHRRSVTAFRHNLQRFALFAAADHNAHNVVAHLGKYGLKH